MRRLKEKIFYIVDIIMVITFMISAIAIFLYTMIVLSRMAFGK